LAAPFVSILHFLPREGVFRRLRFAKWLSEEISFRDGSGGSRIGRRRTTGLLSPGWISQVSSAGASCQEIPPVRIESHDLKRNPWEFLN
ncbi:MAG: hypothetical protein KDD60_08660, partial [Bdellovibrionales bacterium]|nr:hypothetical protein [Bdellovibrionales bacterium]